MTIRARMFHTLLALAIAGPVAASGEADSAPWWKAPKAPATAPATAGSAIAMKKTPAQEVEVRLQALLPDGASLSGDPKAGTVALSLPLDRIEPGVVLEKLVNGVTQILLDMEEVHLAISIPQADEAGAAAAGEALNEVLVSRGVDVSRVSIEPGSGADVELRFTAP